ncbi:hypothetical protein HNS38_01270 [Lentimicrobium sp. L6]|uniref:hypothetical protein n=1 Tax=Lentimicrobium sp. L6 TaxID=2735916 RepID=UPI0015571B43|nr:hypothetical protein [Lentimicrobium sp. L6]NPD83369.1 hypothetical protein [Lentimicrobium sp. L6]
MIKKISILISSTIGLYALWLLGLEKIYAQILKFGASFILSPFSNVTPVLKLDQAHPDFCVAVGQDGYCMELELFGLSIIVMLSWYIMLVALNTSKKMLVTALKHIGIFYLLQILTMATLALYDFGTFFQQVNSAMRQSFIIIALIFIIWDNYLYGVFRFGKE